jgi:S1-C subfamily serine protease
VYRVAPDIADQTGLRDGDVIYAVNNVKVTTADDIRAVFTQARRGQLVRFFLERGGQGLSLTLPIP